MSVIQTGVIFISKDGRYLNKSQVAGHGGPRDDYTLVKELDHATVFTSYDLRHNKQAEICKLYDGGLQPVHAYVTRAVLIGIPAEV